MSRFPHSDGLSASSPGRIHDDTAPSRRAPAPQYMRSFAGAPDQRLGSPEVFENMELEFLERFALAHSNEERLAILREKAPSKQEEAVLFGILSELEGFPEELEQERQRLLETMMVDRGGSPSRLGSRLLSSSQSPSDIKSMDMFTFRKMLLELDLEQPADSQPNKDILEYLAQKVLSLDLHLPKPPPIASVKSSTSQSHFLTELGDENGFEEVLRARLGLNNSNVTPGSLVHLGADLLRDFRVYNYLRKHDLLDLLADLVAQHGVPDFAGHDERKHLIKKALKSKNTSALGNKRFYESLTNKELYSLVEGFSITASFSGETKRIQSDNAYINALLSRIRLPFGKSITAEAKEQYVDDVLEICSSMCDKNHQLRLIGLYNKLLLMRHRNSPIGEKKNFVHEFIHFQRDWYLRCYTEAALQKRDKFQRFNLTDPMAKSYLSQPKPGEEQELIEKELMEILGESTEKKVQAFTKIFVPEYLVKLQAEAKLLSGASDYQYWFRKFSSDQRELDQLKSRVELQFAEYNSAYFDVESDVTLDIVCKNTPKLQVSVYELNLPNFYLENQQELRTDIDLDGLLPYTTTEIEIDSSPWVRTVRSFHVEAACSGKMGAFVIEVSGNGKSCRSILRKGTLNYISRNTHDGIALSVLDSSNSPIDPGNLMIRTLGRTISGLDCRRTAQGEMLFESPLSGNDNEPTVVLLKSANNEEDYCFASLFHLNFPAKKYTLCASSFLEKEMTITGKGSCRLSLRARAYQSQFSVPVPTDRLKNASVACRLVDLSGRGTTQIFNDLTFSADEDTVIELELPPMIARIEVSCSCHVEDSSGGLHDSSSAADVHHLSSSKETHRIRDFYLKYFPADQRLADSESSVKAGYRLYCLGKNGEVYPGTRINVQPLCVGSPINGNSCLLETNNYGFVALGELDGFNMISVTHTDNTSLSVKLALSLGQPKHDFPRTAYAFEGKNAQLRVPVPVSTADNSKTSDIVKDRCSLSLFEVSSKQKRDSVNECLGTDSPLKLLDQSSRISIDENSHMLQVHKLPAGIYYLWIFDTAVYRLEPILVKLIVFPSAIKSGITSSNALETFTPELLQQARLLGRGFQCGGIQLTSCDVIGKDFESAEVKFECYYIKQSPRRCRISVAALCLEPGKSGFASLAGLGSGDEDAVPGSYGSAPSKTEYVKSRVLDEEQRYILSRNDQVARPGSTLSRPSLLMNPFEIGDATVSRKEAQAGTAYESRQTGGGGGVARRRAARLSGTRRASMDQNSSSCEFLPGKCYALFNCELNEEIAHGGYTKGSVTLRAKDLLKSSNCPASACIMITDGLSSMSCVLSISFSQERQQESHHPADPLTATFRDVSYQSSLSSDTHVVRRRVTKIISPDAVLTTYGADDNSVTEFACTTDVMRFFKALHEALGVTCQASSEEIDIEQFCFLANWSELNEGKKRLFYMCHACFEFNLFLFRKDRDFFEREVQPLLQAKTSKTILDQYVLGMDLSKYTTVSNWDRLNAVEKCLVLDWMRVQDSQCREKAFLLANDLRQEAEARADDNTSKIYDVALFQTSGIVLEQRPTNTQLPKTGAPYEVYAEHGYCGMPNAAPAIQTTHFWADLASHCVENSLEATFLSPNFWDIGLDLHEQLICLAVLDVPTVKPRCYKHAYPSRGLFEFSCEERCICMYQTLEEVEGSQSSVLVGQNYRRASDRKPVATDEFMPGVTYECQLIATNVSGNTKDLEIMYQIPSGSINLGKSSTSGVPRKRTNAYSTSIVEYSFYFPQFGEYSHYPMHVSSEGELVAHAYPAIITVCEHEPPPKDTQSWEYIAKLGSSDEVLKFLIEASLKQKDVNLGKIMWRCADEAFWKRLVDLLQARRYYFEPVFKLGFKYFDLGAIATYLLQERPESVVFKYLRPKYSSAFLNVLPEPWSESKVSTESSRIVHASPFQMGSVNNGYHHLEYSPLINARAHQLGDDNPIRTDKQRDQWRKLLTVICFYSPRYLTGDQRMAVCYHLLLQDRISEADSMFQLIKCSSGCALSALGRYREKYPRLGAEHPWSEDVDIPSADQLQETSCTVAYDYMSAYLEFRHKLSNDVLETARAEAGRLETAVSETANTLQLYLSNVAFAILPVASTVASRYVGFQAVHWQRKFEDVTQQLIQLSKYVCSPGLRNNLTDSSRLQGVQVPDESIESRDRKLLEKEAETPSVSVSTEQSDVKIIFRNVEQVILNYYLIDVELLFSKVPFELLQPGSSKEFTLVQPFLTRTVDVSTSLEKGKLCSHLEPVPESLTDKSMIIQCTSLDGSCESNTTQYSTSMDVRVLARHGLVAVRDQASKEPLPGVYVKVYARTSKQSPAFFYKDGYTDIVGKFDYAMGIRGCQQAHSFALLVQSRTQGSTVVEAEATLRQKS
eukprot:gb/GECG01013428.1/.p1 GENE.gb/GECG01013428.1/~~gb/GECG01013428.1/.p1  ORF type:complete len:2385 (+),score=281.41 gb/GECG01013428.1/:1-7155(+)